MPIFKPPALDKAAPIVDEAGRITPYFQRFWQNLSFTAAAGAEGAFDFGPQIASINGQITTINTALGGKASKLTSFTAATGTAERSTFATYTAPTISASPTQAEVQAIANHLQVLSRRFKAAIDDLKA